MDSIAVSDGLSSAQAEESRRLHGSNDITGKKKSSFIKTFIYSLNDPIIKILLGALAVNLLLLSRDANIIETIGIAAAIFLSAFVSAISEHSSEKAFARMQKEAAETVCAVWRDGCWSEIPGKDIVVGDIVSLSPGETIQADGVLIRGELSVDQSSLDGESAERTKRAVGLNGSAGRSDDAAEWRLDDKSKLFRSSRVSSGEGIMRVCRVGEKSMYGGMANELSEDSRESPLKEKLTSLAKTLSRIGYCAALLVLVISLIDAFVLDGSAADMSRAELLRQILHSLTLAISVVVVAAPEGLPMMITVVLSSNMLRMQRDNVMVRKPVGIETAGSMNILFTDKTGTLTYGKPEMISLTLASGEIYHNPSSMSEKLRELFTLSCVYNSGTASARGSGGAIPEESVSISRAEGIKKERTSGKYDCADSGSEGVAKRFNQKSGKTNSSALSGAERKAIGGNAADRALLSFVLPVTLPAVRSYRKTGGVPFDSRYKFSSAELTGPRNIVLVKGAPERIISCCTHYVTPDGGSVPITDTAEINKRLEELAKQAYRVIAIASSPSPVSPDRPMSGLTLIGLAAIRDAVRRESPKAVRAITGAGIQMVMMTGDNIITAEAIASECGLLDKRRSRYSVIDSAALAEMSDEDISAHLSEIRVIARALPSDKSRLVRIAQNSGMVTGMTGDGVNDAPALKRADVGFAMGGGCDIAKDAAEIIILDNNIASIARAILYGRTTWHSIRKFLCFQLTMNLCAVGVSVIGPFIGYDTPVTVIQMLWVNIIMDTLAALAFAGEPPLERYMREPPKSKSEPILTRGVASRIIWTGGYTILLCTLFLSSSRLNGFVRYDFDGMYFMTAFFALFIFCGIFNSLNARANGLGMFSGILKNRAFIVIMSFVSVVQLLLLYFGGSMFRTAGLTSEELRKVLLLSATVLPAGWAQRIIAALGRKRI